MEILIIRAVRRGRVRRLPFWRIWATILWTIMPAGIILKFAEFLCRAQGGMIGQFRSMMCGREDFQEFFRVLDTLREGAITAVCCFWRLGGHPVSRYKETRRRHPLYDAYGSIKRRCGGRWP